MAKAVNSKVCLKCGRVLPLNNYYSNKSWKEQNYHDAFCRECYSRMCKDEDSVAEYFYENNRKWTHQLWQVATKRAEYNLSNNEMYLKADGKTRLRLLDEAAARIVPSAMNLTKYYIFVPNQNVRDVMQLERQRREREREAQTAEYSKEWRGNFTKEQIEILDEMYDEYEKDYDVSTVNRRDAIRKLCKASLDDDNARQKLKRGQITVAEYEKFAKIFHDLSEATATSERSRKAGGSTALNSLGNIILGLQINHHLDINPFTFPEDDVDKVYADYAHLTAAVGAQI